MPRQTPSQTIGPFFHHDMFLEDANIMVSDQTRGQRITIVGQVFDGEGEPVTDAMVELWQADAQGYFNHPQDPNQAQADRHFRGFGRAETVNNGRFVFQTIKPGCIPGQATPYVNVRVFARGMLIHAVTRLYFDDEAGNADDPVLNSIDPARRRTLIAQEQSDSGLTYCYDIHLQGEQETVFFDP
jgi:protocatechuate 3,4-dioxygenase alpha subunit